jgi:hypothetical protein
MKDFKIRPVAILADGSSVDLKCEIREERVGGFRMLHATIANESGRALRVEGIELARVPLESDRVEVFRQGFFMPSDPAGFHVLKSGEKAKEPGGWKRKSLGEWDFSSHSMVVVREADAESKTLLGCASFERFECRFVFHTDKSPLEMSIRYDLEGLTIADGECVSLETLAVGEGADFNALLNAYADMTGKLNDARIAGKTVTGWIDWQYYREDKSADDVRRTMDGLSKLREKGFPLEYVIIDGGWCDHASEWLESCGKFPGGMKLFADEVGKRGFKLGLWLAPYLTNVNTKVVAEHPEWLVMDEKSGEPLYKPVSNVGPCHMLDFTVPEALEWLRDIVNVMVSEWGIGYLKLDGPCAAHYDGGVFRDPNATTTEVIRRSLEVIREACGPNVVIEGEGIYGPSIGFVDTQRTTQDNHPYWYFPDSSEPCMRENLKNDLLSAFTHRRFWHNHRENVIVRDFPSPHHHRKDENGVTKKDLILSENEMRSQLSATALAGGAMLLTDPMEIIAEIPKKVDLISKFLPHYEGMAAEPVDVFNGDGSQPSVYSLKVSTAFDAWMIVGVFNWSDEYRDIAIPAAAFKDESDDATYHFFEFWESAYLGMFKSDVPARSVPAHGAAVFAVRRNSGTPMLLGTDMHILQGAVDLTDCQWRDGELSITVSHVNQKEKTLFIHNPDGWFLADLTTNAENHLVDARTPNLLKLHFNGGNKATEFLLSWNER